MGYDYFDKLASIFLEKSGHFQLENSTKIAMKKASQREASNNLKYQTSNIKSIQHSK